jgi:hypothetical protein
MKIRSIFLAVAVVSCAALSSIAGGTITNVDLASDGDGAIDCYMYLTGSAWESVSIDGIQHFGPGHIVGQIQTDTELDPTLTLNNTIDNDTGFAWSGYLVNIYLNKPFTIPTVPTLNAPAGWSLSTYVTPAFNTGTNYMASILFVGGTPIPDITGQIDFTYQISFAGSASFTEELIPIAVPEPTALSLVLGGGLVLAARRISRRQSR